jgi:2-keto-4-pentenoate hydratase/2-oxohepta-3-ene-1,7-dioic acid hydratase in catechol pathway
MRLVSFAGGFGRVEGDMVVPMGDDILAYLGGSAAIDGAPLAAAGLRFRAPVPRPGKVIGIGLNYVDHITETGAPAPSEPPVFGKYANSIIGSGEAIVIPAVTKKADYEVELVAVIGRRTRLVTPESALAHVAGYMCGNDVSARDLQTSNAQWTRGKAIDTFMPCGPWLVTADEVGDPQSLRLWCEVSGERLQDSNTSRMIWSVAELVSILSQTMTLEPGDLITTGTPPGVGSARTPERYLRPGDEVVISIDRLGILRNPVVGESADGSPIAA